MPKVHHDMRKRLNIFREVFWVCRPHRTQEVKNRDGGQRLEWDFGRIRARKKAGITVVRVFGQCLCVEGPNIT